MSKITIKTDKEILTMIESGKILVRVKNGLIKMIKAGVSALDVENMAVKLIKEEKAYPSFMMVPNYHWATCVNINQGMVHGIPKKEIIFKSGDVISVDVGVYYKGFHTDTSFTLAINPDKNTQKFLDCGKLALKKAIKVCKEGKYISDISQVIEDTVKSEGYSPILALTGHGVGRKLHEEPMIPCFVTKTHDIKIKEGMALAVEVMYAVGHPDIVIEKDGWTISMRDDKISALYEETVAVTKHGPIVLTEG
ncbi:type I methionyl aminopeptidase [Patescibacteria group bacterium]|nr:type I methionyl aminopeptidase [Patescibacteria group bacterium]MBU2035951.1 type I methionyl aminopeptidase [Patescibacteria group bacterium]